MTEQTQQQPKWLTIATAKDGMLSTSQRLYFEDMLREEMAEYFDREYGPGNWLITPTDQLPKGYDPMAYTISAGQFIPALGEVLAVRAEAEKARKAEALRAKRDELLIGTDKYLIPDFPLTDEQREQYLAYRQYLRDVPEADGFPEVQVMTFKEFAMTE